MIHNDFLETSQGGQPRLEENFSRNLSVLQKVTMKQD